jgi:tetratricopeptide (TPR) repeat protein
MRDDIVMDAQPLRRYEAPSFGRPLGAIVVLLALVLIVFLVMAITKWRSKSEKTPVADNSPLNFDSPYRNVRPDVRYVGDEVCSRCHAALAAAYRKHPMSRSLAPVSVAEPLEGYDLASHNPFEAQGFHYQVERRGQQVFHKETLLNAADKVLIETKAEVQFALGSGIRGRSYLVSHDGYLFQSPISWFTQGSRWDLAPGYEAKNNHFNRPITANCLNCHANRAELVPDTINHFRLPIFQGYAIGCERCHGPGEVHVRERESHAEVKGFDDTIVNPSRLDPVLREGVCQQCHLQGQYRIEKRNRPLADYRPGLPLQAFVAVYVRPAQRLNQKKAVGHVEQMYASRCFQASRHELGCISCHDPHDYPGPTEKVDYYRQRCQACHQDNGCKLSIDVRRLKSKEDSCIECHMPRFATSDIAHTASTNHRIPRFPDKQASASPTTKPMSDKYPLVYFPSDLNASDEERDRDLGIALAKAARFSHETLPALQALKLLEPGLQRWPDDVLAWEAKGHALSVRGQPGEALKAFKRALDLHPQRENSLIRAAALATRLQEPAAAMDYCKRAITVDPWDGQAFNELAILLAKDQEWKAAAEHCQKALELYPADLETRKLLLECYLRLGDQTRARAEFDVLLGLDPDSEPLRRRLGDPQH